MRKFDLHKTLSSALILTASLHLASCSSGSFTLNLMPAPAAFTDTGLPIAQRMDEKLRDSQMEPVFFATDRTASKDGKSNFYSSDRGGTLRVGTATVVPGNNNLTWNDARQIALLKNPSAKFPIKIGSVNEYGVLPDTLTAFSAVTAEQKSAASQAARRYAREINKKLSTSKSKYINIYIHGYNTTFESPVLTAAELWHYMGNDGVFISYAWSATPKALAYFSDSETAVASARNLREFIHYLSRETNAKKINIIAYSAGTKVLTRTLGDLALEKNGNKARIGTAVLLASDVDRGILAGHLSDGLLNVVDQLVIYQSDADLALKASKFFFGRMRTGQPLDPDKLTYGTKQFLQKNSKLSLVDVSKVDSATKGNGHGYLRKSPWVSSDLLMSFAYQLRPAERGLVRMESEIPVWTFPPDYTDRLRKALLRQRPELGKGLN